MKRVLGGVKREVTGNSVVDIRAKFWTGAVVALVVVSALSLAPTQAQESGGRCVLSDIQTDIRPGPNDKPVAVTIGFRLIDVTNIDDVSQTIAVDFLLSQSWVDPRLTAFEGCQFELSEVWVPQVDVINAGRLFKRLRERIEVLASGRVRHMQRISGSLVFAYYAQRFPFDRHKIGLLLLSVEYGERDVVFDIDEELTGKAERVFNVPNWEIAGLEARVGTMHLDVYDRDHSAFNIIISANRLPYYYIWKVIMPLFVIIMMSWSVFWIDPAHFGSQVAMSSASMLTLIAFQITMSNMLPPLNYFTDLDRFAAASTLLVFLALVQSIMTSYLVHNDRRETALRTDGVCRWLFPLAFMGYTGWIFYL